MRRTRDHQLRTLACAFFLAMVEPPSTASAAAITEFPLPAPSFCSPCPIFFAGAITAGPDGNLWFTDLLGTRIGRITPDGVITEFSLPTAGETSAITAGPDGNVWFVGGNRIGRITPAGVITEFPIPANSFPSGITAGPDGNLWFTMAGSPFAGGPGNRIGRITPAGVITEFPIPTLASGPNQITAGPDGNLWFTETLAAKIGRITPAGAITEFPVPTTDSGPSSITAGPDGNVWFTERFGNRIGRITPGGVITEFLVVQAPGFFLGAITAGPDGALWFTEEGSVPTEDGFSVGMAGIGRITPDGAITGVPFRKTFAFFPQLGAITAGPDGNLWFTARMRTRHFSLFGGIIGRLTPSAPSPIPTLTLGLNQTRFTAGQILRLTATLTPGTDPPAPVDAYVVVQLPGGELLSLQPGGRVVPGVAPIARDFNPFAFSEQVLQVPFSGLEVPGPYQWFGALTEPGALNVIDLIGRVTQTPFTLGP